MNDDFTVDEDSDANHAFARVVLGIIAVFAAVAFAGALAVLCFF